jgi:polysaccharide biosynthesis/export protein
MKRLCYFLWLIAVVLIQGCVGYKQNILFKTKETIIANKERIELEMNRVEKNYIIQKGDYLEIALFSQKGEYLVEPLAPTDPTQPRPINPDNRAVQFNSGNQQNQNQSQNPQGVNSNIGNTSFALSSPVFLVEQTGNVNLPMIGSTKLDNLTLSQADSVLSARYETYYKGCYARTRYINKRVVVFKGNFGTIFPLRNEKINLIEVLAQTGGFPDNLKGANIRLIRGNLRNPDVYVINLQTIEGLRQYDLTVEPNDIIYVEPIRRSFLEALRDLTPVFSLITSVLTLGVLILR